MKRLIATVGIPRQQWLQVRRTGVCGSDASIILGINKYKSSLALWKEKTNQVPIEESETNYTHFGHVMEPIIKKEFTNRTGLKVRSVNFVLQSDIYEWMLADIDGVVKEEDGSYSLFEAKTATEFKKDVWEEHVPEEYYAQVQHYLFVTGFKKAYVCAIVGGNTYFCHEIMRDEDYMTMLVEKEKDFWECVTQNVQPLPDGSKATSQYLNELYSEAMSEEVDLPENAEELAQTYISLEGQIKVLNEKKETVTNMLKDLIKDNEKGRAGKHIILWKSITKKTLNTSKAKSLLGEAYDECITESTYRRFSVA